MHTMGLSAKLDSGRFRLVIFWPSHPMRWFIDPIVEWNQQRLLRRQILDLDNHMLRDIGLDQMGYENERERTFGNEIRHPML